MFGKCKRESFRYCIGLTLHHKDSVCSVIQVEQKIIERKKIMFADVRDRLFIFLLYISHSLFYYYFRSELDPSYILSSFRNIYFNVSRLINIDITIWILKLLRKKNSFKLSNFFFTLKNSTSNPFISTNITIIFSTMMSRLICVFYINIGHS